MEFKGLEIFHRAIIKDLKCKSDCLAAAIHVMLINKGLYCTGSGEKCSPSSSDGGKPSELLPEGWNDVEDVYFLRYVSQSEVIYLLKIVKADNGSTLLVNMFNSNTGQSAGYGLDVQTYIPEEDFKKFKGNYTNLDSLHQSFQTEIASKLKIELDDPQTSEEKEQLSSNVTPNVARPRLDNSGRRPTAPTQEDINIVLPIGSRDLDPLGGLASGTGGGMLMDPSSILPSGPTLGELGIGGPRGLPRGSVPPGARFDPIGPVIPGRPGTSDPDPDHLPPRSQ